MADISKIIIPGDSTTYDLKDSRVQTLNKCYAPIRNFLSNSNFSNPVNTNNLSSYTSSTSTAISCIDNWTLSRGQLTISSNYCTLSSNSSGSAAYITQVLSNAPQDGDYTIVFKVDSTIIVKNFTISSGESSTAITVDVSGINCIVSTFFTSSGSKQISFSIRDASSSVKLYYFAMYRGTYTSNTLPAYQGDVAFKTDIATLQKSINAKPDFSDIPTIPTTVSSFTNDANYITSSDLSSKQDVINDLATIRSGAAAGATALQSVPSTYRTASQQDAIHDSTKQDVALVTAIDSSSDDTSYPSAKSVYDFVEAEIDKIDSLIATGSYGA